MTYLLLQTFLLLLASYFLGAFVACMVKRAFFASAAEEAVPVMVPMQTEVSVPPVVMPPQPVRVRPAQPAFQTVAPRAIDPVQPKIEVLRRPEPRPAPTVLDPSRFERALIGPDFNEGVPRISIIEVRQSVLEPVTGIYVPMPPPPPEPPPALPVVEETLPEPEIVAEEETPYVEPEEPVKEKPEPRTGGLAARLRDATTAAAAGAVAAAKAAAAASVAFPVMGASRRAQVEEPAEEKIQSEPEAPAKPIEAEAASIEGAAAAHPDSEEELSAKVLEEVAEEPIEDTAEPEDHVETESVLAPEAEPEPEPQPEIEFEPEPVLEPSPQPQPEAKVEAAPVLPAMLVEGGDDFQRIRAIDSAIEQQLKARGIIYFEHIAGWSASDVRRVAQELEIPGRIEREQWVEQAQILAKGGETYYSRNRKAMLKANAETAAVASDASVPRAEDRSEKAEQPSQPASTGTALQREPLSGVASASQGRSVAEMAAAAAAAIAAASASVTRGLKPIEPISPLSKVDPKISMPARITDAIREKESAATTVEISKEEPAAVSSDAGDADDLKRIRGIGVLIEKRLNAMAIRRYDQIANWTSGDIDRVSRMLEFKGRIERESWVEQARILASGGQTEFSRRVDRGEVDTSRET